MRRPYGQIPNPGTLDSIKKGLRSHELMTNKKARAEHTAAVVAWFNSLTPEEHEAFAREGKIPPNKPKPE